MTEKEIVDGVTVYSDLYKDGEWTWNLLIRVGGSISLYATKPGLGAHAVVYDTLDNQPPNEMAVQVMTRLATMAEGVNALLEKAQLKLPVEPSK